MVFKIKTSKKTEELFLAIEASENLQPYALSKLAISLSLKSDAPLSEDDFKTDNNGLELNRQTITGEYDELYKCLVTMKEKRHVDDDEYFQKYIKAHLDRGATLLYSEFRYGGDFVTHLLSGENGI
jgi:DNA sulfur modification protein DndE